MHFRNVLSGETQGARQSRAQPCLAGTAAQDSSPPATRAQSRDPFHRWRVKVRRAFRVLDGDWCLDVLAVGFFFFFLVSHLRTHKGTVFLLQNYL